MTADSKRTTGTIVTSPVGRRTTDTTGSPVAGVRMDPAQAYAEIPVLLQQVINNHDNAAWDRITEKIDYICTGAGIALAALDRETGFIKNVQEQVRSGRTLVFKPNLVGPSAIDPVTHAEGPGALVCTDWTVVAALMRFFHDSADIPYHQMAVAEASTSGFLLSTIASKSAGRRIPPEAIFEGKSGDYSGGWGFYFARQYLASRHPADHTDNPMQGFSESEHGTFLPPGKAGGRLMVYDLNDLGDNGERGRTIPVPEGANFSEVTLHKVIIGGDPSDPADMADYPGCVLINVPKQKIHAQDLITNAIKNLGIGLYPTRCRDETSKAKTAWKYAMPATDVPSFKGFLPHMPWVAELDETTQLPARDRHGNYRMKKTRGMPGTQADVIRAVQALDVMILHISDAIDMINLNHNPEGIAVRVPEGYLWSSLDCVALDHFMARYCFKTVPMAEGLQLKEKNGWPTEFVHHVPVAEIRGKNIVTTTGLDSPLFRYNLYRYAEERGVGSQAYYVTGMDRITGTPLASLDGHLGRIENGTFTELMTTTMYHNLSCLLWDLQKTILSYAAASDRLTGSSAHQDIMEAFDENDDGVIDYDENGRMPIWTAAFNIMAIALDCQIREEYGQLKGPFFQGVNLSLRFMRKDWNIQDMDFARDYIQTCIAATAFSMAHAPVVSHDSAVPGMQWGQGMWPSWECARQAYLNGIIYGGSSPEEIRPGSLYGSAFGYADKIMNSGQYTGSVDAGAYDPAAITNYFRTLKTGSPKLDFVFFVPEGLGSLGGTPVPNVVETSDLARIFTARFRDGKEIW